MPTSSKEAIRPLAFTEPVVGVVIREIILDDADTFCQWLLESFSYKEQTVMLAPASGFYGTPGLGKQEVRLAYVLNTTAINAAMDCLEKALEEYNRK